MRWFGRLCIRLQNIGKGAESNPLKLVPLLLSFPCFEASHFFFKLAYTLQERQLRLASGEGLALSRGPRQRDLKG